MAVRSLCLGFGDVAAGATVTAYTVPLGRTAILKDVRIWAPFSSVTRASVYLNSGPTAVSMVDDGVGFTDVLQVSGAFCVLEPGQEIRVFSQGGAVRYWLSGAELIGTA